MKRPLFSVGITMLFVLFILCQAENIFLAMGVCGLFSVLLLVCLKLKKQLRTLLLPTVFLSVAVSCFVFIADDCFVAGPYSELNGKTGVCTFTLTEYPSYNDGRYYCMSKYKDERGKTYKVRLSMPSVSDTDYSYEEKILSAEPGDELSFVAKIYTVGGENKDIRDIFRSKGIYLGAFPLSETQLEKNERVGVKYYLKREKKRTENLLLSHFDISTASIGKSLLTGEKNLIDNGSYETVKRAGVSHLFAVSGLHLSVWIMLVMRIIENTGLNRRRWAILLLMFDFLVMFFASFSGSVVRAGIMMAAYLSGIIVNKNSDSLNSLGFSATVILLLNPYSAVNVSFLLSFIACFSIITVAIPIIEKAESRSEKYLYKKPCIKLLTLLLSAAVISITVTVYTLPVMIYYFGTVSTVSVITNMLLLPVSTPVIVSFGLYVMLWFVPVISDAFRAASYFLTKYLLFCVNLTGTDELSLIRIGTGSVVLCFFLSVLLLSAPFLYEYMREQLYIKKLFRKNEA